MILFLLLIIVLSLILWSWLNLLRVVKSHNIKGPCPLPLIGNALDFIIKPTEFLPLLERYQRSYGKIVLFHLLSEPYAIMYHPIYIEGIVSHSEIITKGRSYDFLKDWLGDGLLTSTGSKWRLHRKFLTPAFHFNILQNFLPVFWKNEKILRENLMKFADGETDLDLFPIIALSALDNVTESIMGVSFDAQKDSESKYVKAINVLTTTVANRMRNPFLGNETIFNLTSNKKIQDDALNTIHSHTKKVIQMRRDDLEKSNITTLPDATETGIKNKHAFLDLLLLSKIDGKSISNESVREEVDTFLFEGHDTTTSAICFTLFCISRHHDVQQKLLDEQKQIFLDDINREATYSELQQMKYMEMVIKESMRLFPSVPLIERMITKNVDIEDICLKENTSVVIDIFHMQRLKEFYEDPEEFRPERFGLGITRNPFSWLAFSAGSRNCIGQKFAMLELKVTLSGIIRHFELLPSKLEPELVADIILRSENGVNIKLKQRNVF